MRDENFVECFGHDVILLCVFHQTTNDLYQYADTFIRTLSRLKFSARNGAADVPEGNDIAIAATGESATG